MKNNIEKNIIEIEAELLTNPMNDNELEQVLGGGGDGAIFTLTHECHMNTWQFLFTCCS